MSRAPIPDRLFVECPAIPVNVSESAANASAPHLPPIRHQQSVSKDPHRQHSSAHRIHSDKCRYRSYPATYKSYFKRIKDAQEITIPKLNEMACEQVEVAGVPYVSFVTNKNAKGEVVDNSFVLRGYVRHWLGQVWGEFDRVKLLDLVAPKLEKNLRQVAG